MKKNNKESMEKTNPKVAPGVDPEESFGEDANLSDIATGDSTTVTRLSLDENDPS